MSKSFLLQLEHDGYPTEDVAAVHEAIKEHNWLIPDDRINFTFSTIEKLPENISDFIPVGSIEFVEKCLNKGFEIKGLSRIFIPGSLSTPRFLGRQTAIVSNKADIEQLYNKWGKFTLFVKSASKLKCDFADIYRRSDNLSNLPLDTRYFVSEVLNILSEWRVFVRRGKIQDIKNYSGDPWSIPDKNAVLEMVANFHDAPPSYTLDVAVTKERNPVLIEVHNFVSCGLYGYNKNLIGMLRDGYNYELKRGNHNTNADKTVKASLTPDN